MYFNINNRNYIYIYININNKIFNQFFILIFFLYLFILFIYFLKNYFIYLNSDFSLCKNLKGKTLTNDSLEECYYRDIKEGNICKAKEMKCFSEDEKISLCTDNSNKISNNDKCGPKDGHCPTGKCCSKYGYCGKSEEYCGSGCQSEFGQCTSTTNVKISTNDKCGPKDGHCPTGKCCSKYGYCGKSGEFWMSK